MSFVATAIRQMFPGKRVIFFKPRELDQAVVMAEDKINGNRLRLLYLDSAVWAILTEELGWPHNKADRFFLIAKAWLRISDKAMPRIVSEEELEKIIAKKEGEDDGLDFNTSNIGG